MTETNLVEIIRIDKNQHVHEYIKVEDLAGLVDQTNDAGEMIQIKIQPKDLYEVPHNWLWLLLKGYSKHYLLIVKSDGEAIKEENPKVSGKVLKVARDWKGLGKAINDAFGARFQLPSRAMFLGIAGAIILLGVLIYMGWIPIPQRWFK